MANQLVRYRNGGTRNHMHAMTAESLRPAVLQGASDEGSGVRLRFRADQAVRRPPIGGSDAAVIGSFLHLAPASWLLPVAWWPSFCRPATAVRCLFSDAPVRRVAAKAAVALGTDGADSRRIATRLHAAKYELTMQVFRLRRPGGWCPQVDVRGLDHLDAALRKGNGAILWVSHFVFSSTIAKIGLHRLRHRAVHLSRPEHGFSKTRFGIAALNPIRRRAEDRFLAERITLDRGRMTGTMRRVRARLRENAIVSITVGSWEGRQLAEIPLLGGYLVVATGAITLARQSGATLLPVFAVREPRAESFALQIEPPLTIPKGADKAEAVVVVARGYAARLEPYVRQYPDQWRGWSEWHRSDDPGACGDRSSRGR